MQELFNLSESQKRDIMFLRRVYVLRLHELNEQQATLTAQLQSHTFSPLADVSRVTSITAKLRQNAAARSQLVHRLAWAIYCGVSDTCPFPAAMLSVS